MTHWDVASEGEAIEQVVYHTEVSPVSGLQKMAQEGDVDSPR